jgi:hypothetical protein
MFPILTLLAFIVFVGQASALLIGADPYIIAAPADVRDDAAIDDRQLAFNEIQNFTLLDNLAVDGGFIAAGTNVDSHMIFLNTDGRTSANDTHTWFFDGTILGVMSDQSGSLEVASSGFLGAPGTIYPDAPFNARGLEGNDWYQVSGDSIEVFMRVTEPGDWIRVVTTPVPEPSTMFLLGSGLIGLAWYGRKRQ